MHICLINSNFTEQIMPNFMLNHESGLLSLGAVLGAQGHRVRLINLFRLVEQGKLEASASFCRRAARRILHSGAPVLGFNTRCDTYPIVLNIARWCRRMDPGRRIVFGGPQATFTDAETMEKFPFVDVIVRGEGEKTLPELLEAFEGKKRLEDVDGITFRRADCSVVRNRPRELIRDLDSLPLPDYSLLTGYRPSKKARELGWAYIAIGRGCPFNCTFCSTGKMWQRCYRLRSPGNVVGEMKLLKERYGINRFYLGHDNFLTSRKDVARLTGLLTRSGMNAKWTCSTRIDSVDPEMLAMMARSGCERIFFGVESGSPRMQKDIRKNLKVSRVTEVIGECRDAGIFVILSFIVGFPDETEDDVNQTLEMALEARLAGNCYPYLRILIPIAGTALVEDPRNRLRLAGSWPHLFMAGRLIKRTAWCREAIKKHPALFSSFYRMDARRLPRELPYEAVNLFSTLISAYPLSASVALRDLGLKPVDMLRDFKAWASRKGYNRGSDAVVMQRSLCLRYFPKYIEARLKGRGLSSTHARAVLRMERNNCRSVYARTQQ